MTKSLPIPDSVYLVALDLMGIPRPADPRDARASYLLHAQIGTDRWFTVYKNDHKPLVDISPLGAALAQYVSAEGPFSWGFDDDPDGEFAGADGLSNI